MGGFENLTAGVTFLTICAVGLVVTIISLFFGDHDFHDGHGDAGSRFISLRGISLFAVGFGAVGYLVHHYTNKTLVASVAGITAGTVMMIVGVLFIGFFLKQQSNSLISANLVGLSGIVTTSIPARDQGYGEITIMVQGSRTHKVATTSDESGIPAGRTVKILQDVGNMVIVEKQ